MVIVDLNLENLDKFFSLFEKILNEDFPEYSEKVKKYFLTKDYSKDTFRYFLDKTYRKVLVAMEGAEVLGYLIADQTYGGVGFISFLGVEKSKRSSGVGSKLLEAYEKFSKDKKAHMVKLYTFERIMPFYKKHRFEHIGEEKVGYWGTRNQVMGKLIGQWNEETLGT